MRRDLSPAMETKGNAVVSLDHRNAEVSSLRFFFSPASVAIVGATEREGSVGATVIRNLTRGDYRGRVYPVNPHRSEICGLRCYPSIGAVPEAVDLVVVVTPADTVPGVVGECVSAQAKSIVVISAGFKEKGLHGVALEKEIQEKLRGSGTRLIGPNCLGLMNPLVGLNATFARDIARAGNVAFLSQSGALLTAILDWSLGEQLGFSAIVSTGSMLDVGWGDLLTHFGDDSHTKSILLYMESIGDARSFLSAAREVSFSKPIIVIKAGRSPAAAKAAASHTGAMTGSDEVYDAAFARCGVLRVATIAELFHMADVLGKQPRPRGPRLTVLTNAGGPGVLATDALLSGAGELAELSGESEKALSTFLPPHWSHGNPIDILGDADPERYARAMEVALADPQTDGLLVILAPQGMTNPVEVAERLRTHAKTNGKPVLASWMGGQGVAAGITVLNASGIPAFSYPDAAVRAFESMWRYSKQQRSLYETPFSADGPALLTAGRERAAKIIEGVAASGRTLLTELEAKKILALYGIPTVPTKLAASEDEAVREAKCIGFPVVLKVHSEMVTHKTDVGGVRLHLANETEVREAFRSIAASVTAEAGGEAFLGVTVQPMIRTEGYELILGSSIDSQFGPVLLFGSGGQLVEVYRDRALALPPLNTTLAKRLMEQTKIFRALQGVRGRKAVALPELETSLVRFSELVVDQPRLREIDINPFLASSSGVIALDARMTLHGREVNDDSLPRPAIRRYPAEYIWTLKLKDGTGVTVRPVRPEDETLMVKLHEVLSENTVYLRYFQVLRLDARIAHERLVRNCFVDYDREMALVAERIEPETGQRELLGVGRLTRQRDLSEAELGVVIADKWQSAGLGTELMRRLLHVARAEKIHRIVAHILSENTSMVAFARHFHFVCVPVDDPISLTATLDLEDFPPSA